MYISRPNKIAKDMNPLNSINTQPGDIQGKWPVSDETKYYVLVIQGCPKAVVSGVRAPRHTLVLYNTAIFFTYYIINSAATVI